MGLPTRGSISYCTEAFHGRNRCLFFVVKVCMVYVCATQLAGCKSGRSVTSCVVSPRSVRDGDGKRIGSLSLSVIEKWQTNTSTYTHVHKCRLTRNTNHMPDSIAPHWNGSRRPSAAPNPHAFRSEKVPRCHNAYAAQARRYPHLLGQLAIDHAAMGVLQAHDGQ